MKPRCIACWVTENAPEITAWLAMMVAKVARITSGSRKLSGARRKKGLCRVASAVVRSIWMTIAPCPI